MMHLKAFNRLLTSTTPKSERRSVRLAYIKALQEMEKAKKQRVKEKED